MMRMVLTTPTVFKNRRPEWLGPFNFFLFPLIPEQFGGYPSGFDKSTFLFITPMETNRDRWPFLKGVNLFDGQTYKISMRPTEKQDKVVPDSFRIILNQYLKKPEVKSLAPDGTQCTGTTHGLLRRAKIVAGKLIPIGKETDRRWEQGEDPSMLDFELKEWGAKSNLVFASVADRKRWAKIGIRELMRRTKLSQTAVYSILEGHAVRRSTLGMFRRSMDG